MHRSDDTTGSWPAPWFQHPARTELATGHHLRPLRAADAGLPGLPDGLDPAVTAAAGAARTTYTYGVFDDEEREVLGVVTLVPGAGGEHAVDVVATWVVPDCPSVATALAAHLPGWLDHDWPFTSRHVVAG